MDLGLTGKRALVLGARTGLGAASARALAAEGATVFAASRDLGGIEAMAAGIPSITPLHVDLADLASVDTLIDALLPHGVDILVNNTGGPPPSTVLDTKRETWIAQFPPMAANIFHLTGRLLPMMIDHHWGRIVTIGSSGIEQPIAGLAVSNGLRAAILGWSKTLATEVAAQGITVNMVLPGRIDTDRVKSIDTGAAQKSGKDVTEIKAASIALIPAARYGTAEEFAAAVAFLASQQAGYITGTVVRVDGGMIRGV
jgi:3-oxoacyl-[acyl-carrier protein] reductase